MADFANLLKNRLLPDWNTILYDLKQRRDPDEFIYQGSQMFHGMQGEGKTISALKYMLDLKQRFPKAVIITNLHLTNFNAVPYQDIPPATRSRLYKTDGRDWSKDYIYFNDFDDLKTVLKDYRNSRFGVIFVIDEIHTYFHSHDSKAFPMWVQRVFSQQRKQFLVVLGTVQDWQQLTNVIRMQAKNIILCSKFGYYIRNQAIDPRSQEMEYGEVFFPVKKTGRFFLTKELREGIDTYQVIDSGREVMGAKEMHLDYKLKRDGSFQRKTRLLNKPKTS